MNIIAISIHRGMIIGVGLSLSLLFAFSIRSPRSLAMLKHLVLVKFADGGLHRKLQPSAVVDSD